MNVLGSIVPSLYPITSHRICENFSKDTTFLKRKIKLLSPENAIKSDNLA